jgi:hypothetical protein
MRAFTPGQHVKYVPTHAHGDPSHADCENGVVTSVKELHRPGESQTQTIVFVRFSGCTSQGCDPENLV